jgi:hypothetical protein
VQYLAYSIEGSLTKTSFLARRWILLVSPLRGLASSEGRLELPTLVPFVLKVRKATLPLPISHWLPLLSSLCLCLCVDHLSDFSKDLIVVKHCVYTREREKKIVEKFEESVGFWWLFVGSSLGTLCISDIQNSETASLAVSRSINREEL